jgi:hypothetical protein
MPIVVLIAAALTVYAVLGGLVVPRLKASLRAADDASLAARANRLAIAQVVRSVATLTALVSLGVGLVALALWYPLGDDPDYLAAAARSLEPYRQRLLRVPPIPFLVTGLVLTGLVALVASRLMLARARAFLATGKERERERLESARAAGRWDELAATPEMRQVDQALAETLRVAERIDGLDLPAVAKREQLVRLEARAHELMQRRGELDLLRRMTVEIDLDQRPQHDLGPAELLLPSWLRRGPLARTKAAGRLILGSLTLATMPLVVGVFLRPLGRALDERIVALNEDALLAAERRATESLGAGAHEGAGEWSTDDERIAQRIARRFELALGEHLVPDDAREVLETRARETVLSTLVASSKGRALSVVSTFEEATDLQPLERQALELQRKARDKLGPLTGVGELVEKETVRAAKAQPAVWAKLRERLEDEAGLGHDHVSGVQLAALTASTLLGVALSGPTQEGLGTELDTLAGRVTRELGHDAVERLVRLKSTQFKTALLEGKSLDEAAELVVREALPALREEGFASLPGIVAALPRVDRMPRALVGFPPAVRAGRADVDGFRVRALVTEAIEAARFRPGELELLRLLTPLVEYDDFFPAQRGGELRTERARLAADAKVLPTDALAWTRAREPRRLERYGRANGLVIGRPPAKLAGALDHTDLTFTPRRDRVELVLHPRGGESRSLGAFRQSLVWLALAYAADGRGALLSLSPLAPLEDRRFLVHPAIHDTALACRLGLLVDQLDELASTPSSHEDVDRADAQLAAYALAWAVRARAYDEASEAERLDPRRAPAWLRAEAEARLLDAALGARVDGALRASVRLLVPERSALRGLPQHFDPDLVGFVDDCSNTSDRRVFEGCIARASRRVIADRGLETLSSWAKLPPDAWLDARVDEAPFEADAALDFLRLPAPDDLARISAMFAASARIAVGSPAARPSADDDAYHGQSAAPLEGVTATMRAAIERVLREDPARADIIRDLVEFVVLQRLFRLAFDGILGAELPLERLEELMDLTARRRPVAFRTHAWSARPGAAVARLRGLAAQVVTAAGAIRGERPAWAATAVAAIERCAALPEDPARLWSVDAAALDEACPTPAVPEFPGGAWAEAAPSLRAFARARAGALAALRLRAILDVGRSDGRSHDVGACPAL